MRRSSSWSALAAGAGACALLVGAGAPVLASSDAPVNVVTWSLTDVERTSEGVVVTGTATRSSTAKPWLARFGMNSAISDDWCSAISVVDPVGGHVGLIRADTMRCAIYVASDSRDEQATTTFRATVADPGGTSVDVILADRLIATGVELDGPGRASTHGVWTLVPRSQPLVPRALGLEPRFTRAGASVAGQSVDLSTDVLFAYDSDVLGPDAGAAIDVAAQQLQAQASRTVTITGHTDSQGDEAYNLGLSQRRAEAVRAALAAELGAGWTLNATGVGESEPVADESRPADASPEQADAAVAEAQRVNRRVEVVPG